MIPEIKFAGQSTDKTIFAFAGKYGALAVGFPALGYNRPAKLKICKSVLETITEDAMLFERPLWAETFFERFSRELTYGRLSSKSDEIAAEPDEFDASITVIEPASGGVRIGTVGGHYICMKWADRSVGRLMEADILAEHPEIYLLEDDPRAGLLYRYYRSHSTLKSLNWKFQLLSARTAVIVVAPHPRAYRLQGFEAEEDLLASELDVFCEKFVSEAEGLCLIASRPDF